VAPVPRVLGKVPTIGIDAPGSHSQVEVGVLLAEHAWPSGARLGVACETPPGSCNGLPSLHYFASSPVAAIDGCR